MSLFSVECEAPGAAYYKSAVHAAYGSGCAPVEMERLHFIFDIWLGSDLVQDVGHFCVTAQLWDYLAAKKINGVLARDMTVAVGEQLREFKPALVIPRFVELVLPHGLQGEQLSDCVRVKRTSIPNADMFSGIGLPLLVTERVKQLFEEFGVNHIEFTAASIENL